MAGGKRYLYKDLGERCRELRKKRKLSQLDIVRKFDFSLSHYQKIERGELDPRFTTLKKLAEVYDVTLSELMKGL
ncbi:MAG TPA: helix-turn-helix transcriptional regulator [Polyangia bacterium]|jgi:transcriptional regulator with XRE-family HTH domain